jgi:hypothetical protein
VALAALCRHDDAAAAADAGDAALTHQPRDALAAHASALLGQLGADARCAAGVVGPGVDAADALQQHRVVQVELRRCAPEPVVEATGARRPARDTSF